MDHLKEKTKIIDQFKEFYNTINSILDPINIETKKTKVARTFFVENQLNELFRGLYDKLNGYILYDQLSIELSHAHQKVETLKLELQNRPLNPSTKASISNGLNYILSRLNYLIDENDKKKSSIKSKYKSKYEDVIISEKEFSYFIILAEKYGLISKIPSSQDQAAAFSLLTNISEQNLRENLGIKYKNKPEELLLKKKNLKILLDTLQNICQEIECLKVKLTI